MKTTLKKGTRLFAGDQPIELTSDTEVDFIGIADRDVDGLAAAMSNASHTIYGAHVTGLAHDETVQKTVDGKLCEVDVAVTYGAHGARVETPKGDPRPIKAAPPATPPSVGAVRVETPAASDAEAQQAVNAAEAAASTESAVAEQPAEETPTQPSEPAENDPVPTAEPQGGGDN